MNQLVGREKKAQRDTERRKSGKKRKHEDVEHGQAVGGQTEELQQDFIALDVKADSLEQPSTKRLSKSKKRKLDDGEAVAGAADEVPDTAAPKSKKRRKQKNTTEGDRENGVAADGEAKTNSRFVCFIGNLPYDTTDVSLQAHFKKLMPFTLRHRTDPETKRSKGFAFLEFENYDRMKTCLKLYHHTMFDPNDVKAELQHGDEASDANAVGSKGSKKKGARRINVELTAGGGGKNAGRQEKIKVKNERLNGQRQRRAEAERLEKEKEAQEAGERGKGEEKKKAKKKKKPVEEAAGRQEVQMVDHTAGMHPESVGEVGCMKFSTALDSFWNDLEISPRQHVNRDLMLCLVNCLTRSHFTKVRIDILQLQQEALTLEAHCYQVIHHHFIPTADHRNVTESPNTANAASYVPAAHKKRLMTPDSHKLTVTLHAPQTLQTHLQDTAARSPSNMRGIRGLPAETLERVARFVGSHDLLALRQVNHDFEAKDFRTLIVTLHRPGIATIEQKTLPSFHRQS